MVGQMLHEHAAALSAASPANRSRRLIKCAKESARYLVRPPGAGAIDGHRLDPHGFAEQRTNQHLSLLEFVLPMKGIAP
jgi:hypothetical protein